MRTSDVTSVTVTVAGSELAVPLVIPLVRSGTQFSGLASNLPVGAAYTFTASAVNGATPSVELYHGAVTNQVIQKNATANIIIDTNQVSTFTLSAIPNVSSCDFAVTVTDAGFPDGPASGGQTGGHVIIGVLD